MGSVKACLKSLSGDDSRDAAAFCLCFREVERRLEHIFSMGFRVDADGLIPAPPTKLLETSPPDLHLGFSQQGLLPG